MPWYEIIAWIIIGPPLFGICFVLLLGIAKGMVQVWRGLWR